MTTKYQRREELRITELGDEGVVLHLGSRDYFTVSATGLVILEALREPKTVEELTNRLTEEFDVSEDRARRSVKGFLDKCIGEKLLVESVEASP